MVTSFHSTKQCLFYFAKHLTQGQGGCRTWQWLKTIVSLQLYNCIVTWDFSHGHFMLLSQEKASCNVQPTVHAGCFSVPIIQQTLTWT